MFCSSPTAAHSSASTQRSPFSASTATQPLRVPVPSSHLDVSGSLESGHANARDEEAGNQRESKPEG
jgi:hypothetical protein